jgi:hypothetical protein
MAAYVLMTAGLWQCAAPLCRPPDLPHLRDGPPPVHDALTTWFWAAYLMTTDKRGVSALLLQRHLGVSYKTAFPMRH